MASKSYPPQDLELTGQQVQRHSVKAIAWAICSLADPIRKQCGDPMPAPLQMALQDAEKISKESGGDASPDTVAIAEQVLRRITIDDCTPLFAIDSEAGRRVVRSLYDGDERALALALWLVLAATSLGSRPVYVDPQSLPEEIQHLGGEMVGVLSKLGIKAKPFVRH